MDIAAPAHALLSRTNLGYLGLRGLDGYPRVIPVWFRFTGDEVQVASPPDAYKSQALRADPRAALTVATVTLPYRVVTATGTAEIEVMEEPERIAFVTALATRYLGAHGGREYVTSWTRGGHPGPGDLIRLRIERVRYRSVHGE